jgi:hypothetical protein
VNGLENGLIAGKSVSSFARTHMNRTGREARGKIEAILAA